MGNKPLYPTALTHLLSAIADDPAIPDVSTDHEPTVKVKNFSDIELEKGGKDSSTMFCELGALDSSCS